MALNTPGGSHPATPDPVINPVTAAALDRATAQFARDTDRDPSPGLLPAVMHTVWAELRPGVRIPLPGSGGTLLVTETAVSNALVAHLDGLPEMLVRRCTVQHQPQPAGESTEPAATAETIGITLTAAVAYGISADDLVHRIRTVITVAAEHLFGFTVDRVDIDIIDVYPPAGHLR